MKIFAREPGLGILALLIVLAMTAFIVIPMFRVVVAPCGDLVPRSTPGTPDIGWTATVRLYLTVYLPTLMEGCVRTYGTFLTEGPNWIGATQRSITVMLLSTTTAVILGFAYAYAMVYSRMPWKPYFRVIAILPMLSPPFVVAAAYILLFGPRGLITYGLLGISPNILGLTGLWGVQTIAFFPYAYQLIADVLSRSDPRLEQAARNLGAGPWRVFSTVTLPLSRPGLVSAILLVAIYVLEDFGNPALIAGQYTVLPTLAYGLISGFGDFAGAAVVSTILLLLALVLYVGRLRLEGGNRSYVTVAGRGSSIPRPPVSPLVTWISFGVCLLLSGLILLVYGVLVLSALVESYPFNMAPTLKHFEYVSAHATSLKNSLIYAGIAAAFCSALAIVLAYLTQRKEWSGRSVVDFLAIAPAAVPGIFFGIGYATTFNERWLDWIDRGALITISMIFWNIPVGYRAAVAGLRQIDRSIDEAATSMGASSLRTLREILVPLLHAPLLTAFITGFVRAITTLSVVIFLFTPSTTVATITVFQLINDFNWGGAAAFTVSVIMMAVLVVSGTWILAGRRVRLEEVGHG